MTMTEPLRPPVQDRSRRTLDALVTATERLLETKAFAEISIQEIVAGAACTSGSFYRRFASKEDLLPFLFEKYDQQHSEHLAALAESGAWAAMSLEELIDGFIAETITAYAGRPNLMRELMFFVRRSPERVPQAAADRRDRLQAVALDLFLRAAARDGQAVSPSAALFAMTVIGNSVREMVLFGGATLARSTRMEDDPLREALAAMVAAYLRSPAARA